jgi:putative ABC transport system ATP-binding protein
MKDENNFIQFDQVSKWYDGAAGRFDALKNIDLTIRQGEYLAVVGKSGSGKSTLLNMLTGIDHPSRGTVTINSSEIHTMNESRLSAWRGANIGIVFQFFQLIPTLTILENLLLAMDFVNAIPARGRKERAESLLTDVGIFQHRDKLPAALSGGEQQRAAIARALANNPPILVADEPTGNLDTKTATDIQSIFSGLVDTGKTVIVVTHENVSESLYDRIITLTDGAIIGDTRRSA